MPENGVTHWQECDVGPTATCIIEGFGFYPLVSTQAFPFSISPNSILISADDEDKLKRPTAVLDFLDPHYTIIEEWGSKDFAVPNRTC